MQQLVKTSFGYRITLRDPREPGTLAELLAEVTERVGRQDEFSVLEPKDVELRH